EAAIQALYEAEGSAHALAARARQEIERLVAHDEGLREPAEMVSNAEIELREAALALIHYRDRLEPDPARLELVESRLARIKSLARRHGVTEDELPGVLARLRARIAELEAGGESVEALEAEVERAKEAYFAAARKLSAKRTRVAAKLAKAVSEQLPELGLPHGQFDVLVEAKSEDRADATGIDRVEFVVRLNPGMPFGPLAKIASGGELSRIGLALE